MANDSTPRADAKFHAWRNNLRTHPNSHLTDLGLAASVMGAEARGAAARVSRPRSCKPAPAPFATARPPQKTQAREQARPTVAGCRHFSFQSR